VTLRRLEDDVEYALAGVVEAACFVQLVGAVTNKSDAFPVPGTGVTAALSGTFDSLPSLR